MRGWWCRLTGGHVWWPRALRDGFARICVRCHLTVWDEVRHDEVAAPDRWVAS